MKRNITKIEHEPAVPTTFGFGSSEPRRFMTPFKRFSRSHSNDSVFNSQLSTRNSSPKTSAQLSEIPSQVVASRKYGANHWSVALAGTLVTRSLTNKCTTREWESVISTFDSTQECQVVIINNLGRRFTLCWVDSTGKLYHFYPIQDNSIRDGSVSNSHTEYAHANHAFVGFLQSAIGCLPTTLSSIADQDFLFVYRPKLGLRRHELTLFYTSDLLDEVDCELHCEDIAEDSVIDNTSKQYLITEICGFKVYYEEGVEESVEGIFNALVEDFTEMCRLFPSWALDKVRSDTPLWVNKSITFGTKRKPVIGYGSTFHPGSDWLRCNGMNENKAGCVEMYNAQDHMNSRKLWGPGGVLVHEYSHAFHNKHIPNGYSNSEIQQAFDQAMSRRLYDLVPVHGPQGIAGPQKAYACTNCMEFFAELSVAYHWQCDDTTEYNKWFPHNRRQLQDHDLESFELLSRVWSGELGAAN